MNNNSGKGIRSRYFKTFWVMLLVFALVIPCMNGIRIQVHADDTATVWNLYGHFTEDGKAVIESVSDSGSSEGLVGKFITGGDYSLTEEDTDKLIIADNANITAGNINVADFKLSGLSNFKYPDYTLSSTESRFSSYPASQGAITVLGLQEHYEAQNTPYFEDSANYEYRDPYDLTVSGNFTLAGIPKYNDQGQQVLDEEHNPIIDPLWMGYNDIRVTSTGHISVEDLGYLLVEGSLTVAAGGTITGSGDHYIRICPGATVTGLSLYSESIDHEVSTFFANPSPGEYEFRYDADASKWFYPFDPTWPVFFFSIGGIHFSENASENESIDVQYKYASGDDYTDANPVVTFDDGATVGYGISLKNIPDSTQSFYLKITFNPAASAPAKTMLCWRDSPDPVDPIYDGISGIEFERELALDAFVEISLGYLNSGNPEIVDRANDYLYAYAGNNAEIKNYLATELYNRFIWVPMYERFGLDIVDNNGNIDNAANINELATRITMTGSLGNITAKDMSGANVAIPVNNYKVEWGYNSKNGDPVVSNIPVYSLPDRANNKEEFLICTDFKKDNGTGSTFYIRSRADEVPFDGGGDNAIPVVVSSIDPEKIVAGGMGGDTAVSNMDNIYTFSFSSRWLNADQERGASSNNDPVNYGTIVRVMIESETYVILMGEGEEKRYGGLNLNGYNADSVWNTRSNGDPRANVYIGHNILHLKPLAPETGISLREITAVELTDASYEAGVHINANDLSDIMITFDSNFYSAIPLNITYTDGSTTRTVKLTINRVGLVIQYWYLSGDPDFDQDQADSVALGSDNTSATATLKYDYFAGEQIAVYGIYYTPTNDPTGGSSDLSLYLTYENGTHRVITADNHDDLTMKNGSMVDRNFNGRLAATNDSVATTIFLIGFARAKTFDGNVWVGNETEIDFGGFYASVLNAGWDDDDSFGGAQVGSGQGIYWDGKISWY